MAVNWDDFKLAGTPSQASPVNWDDFSIADQKPQEPSGLVRRALGDTAVSLAKGVIGTGEAAVGLANIPTAGGAGKLLEGIGYDPKAAKATLDTLYSPEQQRANQAVQQAEGFIGKAGTMLQNPSTIAQSVVESSPLMFGGGAIAQGLGKAGMLASSPVMRGAIGEGLVGAGMSAEGTRQETADGMLTPGQVGTSLASGAGTALIGAAGGKIAQKLGIGDVDTMLAQGAIGQSAKGRARRLAEGAITEGVLEEMPQSAQEQVWQNLALDRPWSEGVPEASAMGLVTGIAMGGPAAAMPSTAQPAAPVQPAQPAIDPTAGPLSKAASMAQQTPELSPLAFAPQQPTGPELETDAQAQERMRAAQFAADALPFERPLSFEQPAQPVRPTTQDGMPFERIGPEDYDTLNPIRVGEGELLDRERSAQGQSRAPDAIEGEAQRRIGVADDGQQGQGAPVRAIGAGVQAPQAAQGAQRELPSFTDQKAETAARKSLPFANEPAAQKKADELAQKRSEPFSVIPHPALANRFAVVPMRNLRAMNEQGQAAQLAARARDAQVPAVQAQPVAENLNRGVPQAEQLATQAQEARGQEGEKETRDDLIERYRRAELFSEGSSALSDRLKQSTREEVSSKLEAGEMPVFETGRGTFATITPSAQRPGKFQVTRYSRDGVMGDSQYDSVDDALRSEFFHQKRMIPQDEAESRFSESLNSEVKYQDSRNGQPATAPTAKQQAQTTDIYGMSDGDIRRDIGIMSDRLQDKKTISSNEEIDRYIALLDEQSRRRSVGGKKTAPEQGWFSSAGGADKYLAQFGYKRDGDSGTFRAPGQKIAKVVENGIGKGGVDVVMSDFVADIEDQIADAARFSGKPEREVRALYERLIADKGQAEADRLLSATVENYRPKLQGTDTAPVAQAQGERNGLQEEGRRREEVAPENVAQEATHKDPGNPAEPVTAPVIAQAIQKSARNTEFNPVEARNWLVGEIDKAIANAPSVDRLFDGVKIDNKHATYAGVKTWNVDGPKDEDGLTPSLKIEEGKKSGYRVVWGKGPDQFSSSPNLELAKEDAARIVKTGRFVFNEQSKAGSWEFDAGVLDAKDFVTFDVPGDGKFKVVNTVEKLNDFKAKVKSSPGFAKNPDRPTSLGGTGLAPAVPLGKGMMDLPDIGNAIEIARLKNGKDEDKLLDRFKEASGGQEYDAWRAEQEAADEIAKREAEAREKASEGDPQAFSEMMAMYQQPEADQSQSEADKLRDLGEAAEKSGFRVLRAVGRGQNGFSLSNSANPQDTILVGITDNGPAIITDNDKRGSLRRAVRGFLKSYKEGGKPTAEQSPADRFRAEVAQRKGVDSKGGEAPSVLRATDPDPANQRITRAQADGFLRDFLAKFPGAPKITVVNTFDQLPATVQQEARNQGGNAGDTKGVFHRGQVYLVSGNHQTLADFEATVFHEVVGHAGVRALFGDEFVKTANRLFMQLGGQAGLVKIMQKRGMGSQASDYIKGIAQAQRNELDQIRADMAAGKPGAQRRWNDAIARFVLTEEVFAHVAEQVTDRPSMMDKMKELIGKVRQWLRDKGFADLASMGETDILFMLSKARQNMQGKNGNITRNGVTVSGNDLMTSDGRRLNKDDPDYASAMRLADLLGLRQEPGVTTFSNRRSMDDMSDRNRVASEQSPNPAGDGKKGGATPDHRAAAQQILAAIEEDGGMADYGLRVIPGEFEGQITIGDSLPVSKVWSDGNETEDALDGTSAAGIEDVSMDGVLRAIRDIGGNGKPGPNGYYYGNRVVLVKGERAGFGEDAGEVIIRDAEVVGVWMKPNKGNSELIPNEPSAPVGSGVVPSTFRNEQGTIEVDGIQRSRLNSNGQPIHPTEEGIRNFWRFFKDSKVVDDRGRPLMVYRGGNTPFDETRVSEKFGAHFGTVEQANKAAERGVYGDVLQDGGEPSISTAYLKIENPWRYDGDVNNWDYIYDLKQAIEDARYDGTFPLTDEQYETGIQKHGSVDKTTPWSNRKYLETPEQLRAIMVDNGVDGVIYRNRYEGDGNSYIVFRPEQLKSAIGNTGAFDPNEAPITLRRAPSATQQQGQSARDRIEGMARNIAGRVSGNPVLDPADPFAAENERLRERDQSLWNKAKKMMRRQLAPGGLLPGEVFAEKIKRDSEFQAVEFDVRHMVGGLERAVQHDFGVPFDKLTDEQLKPINEALAGRVPDSLPEATKTAAIAMRQYIDGLSGEYLTIIQGKIDALMQQAQDAKPGQAQATAATQAINEIELYEKIKGNIGAYVHRSYQAFDDPKWFEKVPAATLNAAREYLKQGYVEQGDTEADAKRQAEVALYEILKNGTAYDSMEAFIGESKLGAKDLSVLMRRKEVPPQIRALLGEYTDPRLNFAKSTTKMGRLIWNQRFLDRVREIGMGTFLFEGKDRPPQATKQIAAAGSEVYAPMNGLWTFPEVDQAFRDALGKEQMSDLYRFIVRANGLIKYGKTVLSPTTAMRNWQSAMFFSLANGHFDMTQMKKSIAAFREQVSQRATGGDLAYLRHLKRLGVVYDTPYAGEMMRLLSDARMDEILSTEKGSALRWFRKANQLAQGFYSFGDDFWKIIGFENEKAGLMKAGLSMEAAEQEAAKRIRDTYPTYSMVGRGVNWLSRFPLAGTFVSFPAEIIRTTGNMFKMVSADLKSDNPAMRKLGMRRAVGMAMVSATFFALAALSKGMAGVDDDEEEALRDLAPDWQKNSTFLFLGRDEKGQLRYFDLSFLDPYGYFKRPLTAMMRDQPWEEGLSSGLRDLLTPFLGADIAAKAIMEAVSNKKDSGGRVYKENDGPLDQSVDIADHLRKALQPGVIGNVERMVKAAQGVKREGSGQPFSVEDELVALVGWRASTMDPKTALYYRSFEFNDAITEARQEVTKTLRSVNAVSPDEILDARQRATEKQREAYSEMGRLVQAARNAGMTNAQVMQVLRLSNVSTANIGALIRGDAPKQIQIGPQTVRSAVNQARTMQGDEFAREVSDRYRAAMAP